MLLNAGTTGPKTQLSQTIGVYMHLASNRSSLEDADRSYCKKNEYQLHKVRDSKVIFIGSLTDKKTNIATGVRQNMFTT